MLKPSSRKQRYPVFLRGYWEPSQRKTLNHELFSLHSYSQLGVSEIRVTLLGVLIIRILLFRVLY